MLLYHILEVDKSKKKIFFFEFPKNLKLICRYLISLQNVPYYMLDSSEITNQR